MKEKSFIRLMRQRIAQLQKQSRFCTATNYTSALKAFSRFRKGKDIPIDEITVNTIVDFQRSMSGYGLSRNTVSLYTRCLRAVYNYAADEGILKEDRHPFRKAFTGCETTRKRAVKESVVKLLVDADFSVYPALSFCRDLFLFSVFMQGMAFIDVAKLTTANISGNLLTYRRSKTNREIEIEIPEEAWTIIRRHRKMNEGYLFPLLSTESGTENYRSCLRIQNRRLRRISEMLGITPSLTTYTARHTWASIAKWQGVSVAVISEAMGHSDVKTTGIYLATLDSDTISEANRKVVRAVLRQ